MLRSCIRLYAVGTCYHVEHVNLLGGSWVVISGHISRITIVITYIGGLIIPLITTHEPPSSARCVRSACL